MNRSFKFQGQTWQVGRIGNDAERGPAAEGYRFAVVFRKQSDLSQEVFGSISVPDLDEADDNELTKALEVGFRLEGIALQPPRQTKRPKK